MYVKTGAIIVAAGSSSRMKGTNKLLIDIGGKQVITRTLINFNTASTIDYIIVVTRKDMFNDIRSIKKKYNIDKLVYITEGGETRQESVKNGLNKCAEDTDIIAIHDGARPFTDVALIDRVINDCKEYGASMAGVKVKDTIKEAQGEFISNTLNRENIYIAQTPQVFFFDDFKIAFKNAEAQGLNFTDDCQLIESMGKKVYISQGDYKNIKITTTEDIKIAEAFMEE